MFVIGAIGGFIIALIYIPGPLGWTVSDYAPWWLILVLANILVSMGFFALWRKSGNVIPLVSAIFIIVWVIFAPLAHYLVTFALLDLSWLVLPPIGFIFIGAGWITAGIAAWLLREESSPFSIVAALVFLAFGAVNFLVPLIAGVAWNIWNVIFFIATGIVAGIYFLDAART